MLINENRIGQSNGFVFLFIAIITLSNTSQMPYFIKSGIGRHLTMSIWILALICIILSGLLLLSEKMIFLIIMAMFFTIILLVGEIISPGMYLHSSLVYPFFSSLFIFIIGFFASKKITKNDFKYIIGSYVISTVIVSLSVYFKSFSSGFSWESRVYNYGAKNSISQIILTALAFVIVMYNPKMITRILFKWTLSILFVVQLLMLKSRASILGIVIMIFIILFFDKTKSKAKIVVILFCITSLGLIMLNETFNNIIINNVLFANRNIYDFDDLSSGRWGMFKSFTNLFFDNPWIGRGAYYIESFPLSSLIQIGIIGSIPIFSIAVYPLFWALKKLSKNCDVNIAFIIITSTYLFNGLFEELAPFGPGVKCYMLWLLFGFLLGWQSRTKKKICATI